MKEFTQAQIDEYRKFIEDQMSGYKTDAELVEMMSATAPAEPDAAPVAAVTEDDDAPGFRVGDRVTPALGLQQGLECEVINVLDHYPAQRRYLVQNVETRGGAVSYSEDGLEPYKPDAATDDQRPTVDEARLIDTITELKARVAEWEAKYTKLNKLYTATVNDLLNKRNLLEDECEVLSGHIVALEQARDFWRVKFERLVKANQETEADNG